jgi:hypothetical protein
MSSKGYESTVSTNNFRADCCGRGKPTAYCAFYGVMSTIVTLFVYGRPKFSEPIK